MNNINELLAFGNPIFKAIEEAVRKKQYEDAYMLLDSEPPKEWIEEGPSFMPNTKFYYMKVELVEALMTKIFKDWGLTKIENYITQDRTKFAVTSNVIVEYAGFEPNKEWQFVPGTAAVKAGSIDMLELAIPKAASMSFKNAVRRIGNIFGQSLNRSFEDERTNIPVIQIGGGADDGKGDVEFEEIKKQIIDAATYDEAMIAVSNSSFKLNWKYNFELKQLIESKK